MVSLLDVEKASKAHGCNCSTFPVAIDVLLNSESGESQVDGKILYFIWLKKDNFLVGFLVRSVSKQSCLNLI